MAKRSGFTDEDLTVIAECITKRIEEEVKTEPVEMLAPLFRVREKIIARTAAKSPVQPKTRAARAVRVVTSPAATAGAAD